MASSLDMMLAEIRRRRAAQMAASRQQVAPQLATMQGPGQPASQRNSLVGTALRQRRNEAMRNTAAPILQNASQGGGFKGGAADVLATLFGVPI